jgi:hypothetical protein
MRGYQRGIPAGKCGRRQPVKARRNRGRRGRRPPGARRPGEGRAHNHRPALLRESRPPSHKTNSATAYGSRPAPGRHPILLMQFSNSQQHSRGRFPPELCISLSLSLTEGAGKAGRRLRPQRRVQKLRNNAHGFDRYSRDIPAFPARWLYGLYVLSPGKRPFLPPSPVDCSIGLAPGSRRQDHTISPYAALLRPAADLDPFRK